MYGRCRVAGRLHSPSSAHDGDALQRGERSQAVIARSVGWSERESKTHTENTHAESLLPISLHTSDGSQISGDKSQSRLPTPGQSRIVTFERGI